MKREWQGTWIPKEIWNCRELSWMDKCLWAEIRNLESDEVGGCYASDAYFAEMFGSTGSSIRNKICKLTKLGFIRKASYDGRTRVMVACHPQVTSDVTEVTSDVTHRLHQMSPTGDIRHNPQVTSLHYRENIEKNIDKSTPIIPQGGSDSSDDETSSKYPKAFEAFWEAYPLKRGKGAALKAWKKLPKAEKDSCIPAITAQVRSRHFKGSNGEDFIPLPATWLNQGRFEDEIKTGNAHAGARIAEESLWQSDLSIAPPGWLEAWERLISSKYPHILDRFRAGEFQKWATLPSDWREEIREEVIRSGR